MTRCIINITVAVDVLENTNCKHYKLNYKCLVFNSNIVATISLLEIYAYLSIKYVYRFATIYQAISVWR